MPGVSFAKLKAEVQTGNYKYDQSNLGDSEYAQAVHEGLLEKVDKEAAKTEQLPPSLVREYGIVSYSLGTNLVYRKENFPNGGPQNWADFWNVEKFPLRAVCSTAGSRACVCTACGRRADRQALSDGYRSGLSQDGSDQAAHQSVVA